MNRTKMKYLKNKKLGVKAVVMFHTKIKYIEEKKEYLTYYLKSSLKNKKCCEQIFIAAETNIFLLRAVSHFVFIFVFFGEKKFFIPVCPYVEHRGIIDIPF